MRRPAVTRTADPTALFDRDRNVQLDAGGATGP